MQKPLTLGIAGLGTVGAGLLELLHEHEERLADLVTSLLTSPKRPK